MNLSTAKWNSLFHKTRLESQQIERDDEPSSCAVWFTLTGQTGHCCLPSNTSTSQYLHHGGSAEELGRRVTCFPPVTRSGLSDSCVAWESDRSSGLCQCGVSTGFVLRTAMLGMNGREWERAEGSVKEGKDSDQILTDWFRDIRCSLLVIAQKRYLTVFSHRCLSKQEWIRNFMHH